MSLLSTVLGLVTAAAGGLACSERTLIAVGPCLDGSASVDGAACAPSSLRTGLIGLWHFDEPLGATMAADASGMRNDGTLMELDPSTAWAKGGRLGTALGIDSLGYVLVPFSSSGIGSIRSAVTVSAWVYLDGSVASGEPPYGTAVSRQIGTSINQYYHLSLWQADAKPHLFITVSLDGTAGVQPTSPMAASQKTWTHLAATYDGTTAILYVAGKQIDARPLTGMFPTDTTPLIIGGNGNGTSQTVTERFPGRIDEVALYNRALEAAEIQQLANAVSF